MNAISCLARGKKKRKKNCFALIARFARERGRERQKGKKKMQGRRSDVCVQQVAISNYRIILILGFRGGWVNRRRDLRFHAYLRPTLEFFERILGVVGRREGKGGRHYRRNALHLHAYPAFHELDRASFTIFILSFRSCFFLLLFLSRLWMRNGEGKPRQTGSPSSYRLRKPRFYSCSSSLFALLSFFLSFCWSLRPFSLNQFLVRLKKFLPEWYFNIDSMERQ